MHECPLACSHLRSAAGEQRHRELDALVVLRIPEAARAAQPARDRSGAGLVWQALQREDLARELRERGGRPRARHGLHRKGVAFAAREACELARWARSCLQRAKECQEPLLPAPGRRGLLAEGSVYPLARAKPQRCGAKRVPPLAQAPKANVYMAGFVGRALGGPVSGVSQRPSEQGV